jgi:hypothetical protein
MERTCAAGALALAAAYLIYDAVKPETVYVAPRKEKKEKKQKSSPNSQRKTDPVVVFLGLSIVAVLVASVVAKIDVAAILSHTGGSAAVTPPAGSELPATYDGNITGRWDDKADKVSRLEVRQLTQIHTTTDCCLHFYTYMDPTNQAAQAAGKAIDNAPPKSSKYARFFCV